MGYNVLSDEERKAHPNQLAALLPTQWKPGQSGNPNGARAHNKELKRLRNLTTEQVIELGSFLLDHNIIELQAIVNDAVNNPDSEHTSLKIWIAKIVLTAGKKGDAKALDLLLNRIIGKVPDKLNIGDVNSPRVIVGLPGKDPIIEVDTD